MKRWTHTFLPLVLIAVPMVIEAAYISRFAVNVPNADEWEFGPVLQALFQKNTGQLFASIWGQLNEHRLPLAKLIFLVLAKITNWNVIAEMYASFVIASLSLVAWGLVYRKTCRESLWGFIPVAWLVFSLGQWESILWGWLLHYYLLVLSIILAVYFLTVKSLRSVSLAALWGGVASFSLSNGLLVWPIGWLCLAALRAEKKRLILWSLAGVLVVVTYLIGYVPPGHSPSAMATFSRPLATAVFFLANLGTPLGGGDLHLSFIMGVFVLVLLIVFLGRTLTTGENAGIQWSEPDVVLGSLVLFAILSSVAVTVSRVGFGHLDWAISSRYVTLTSVGMAGIYMLFLRHSRSGRDQQTQVLALFPALLSVLIVGLAASTLYGYRLGENLYMTRLRMKYILQTFEAQPDDALGILYFNPQFVRKEATFLKENNLSAFREPINMLLLTSQQSLPIGEILPQPLGDCRGRTLVLKIASDDASPGNAISVWTYPHYYEGAILEPDEPSLANRVMGLELNAHSYEFKVK